MLKDIYDIFEDRKDGLYQIRCKNDVITVEFDDDEKEQIFLEIINESSKKQEDLDLGKLRNELAKKFKKEKVLEVLDNLTVANCSLEDRRRRGEFSA